MLGHYSYCLCWKTDWAPSQYPKRRLSVRSRKVSKPRDWYFKLSYRFEIWQAHRQHCYRRACQISERSDNSKYKSRGFETLRDLTERRLFGYWDGAQDPSLPIDCGVQRTVARSPTCQAGLDLIPPCSWQQIASKMMPVSESWGTTEGISVFWRQVCIPFTNCIVTKWKAEDIWIGLIVRPLVA